MRDFLRFMFSAVDRDRITSTTVALEDTSVPPADKEGVPLQTFKISGTVSDPANGPLQVRPLFPGLMKYLALSAATGNLPDAADVDLTSTAYATWKTEGVIQVKVNNKTVLNGVKEHGDSLEVVPNVAWYGPVIASETFLFTTLAGSSGLKRYAIKEPGTNTRIGTSSNNWTKHAIAGFLQGFYTPRLSLGADATQDDIVRFDMPTIKMAADGTFELYITVAADSIPCDDKASIFDDFSTGIERHFSTHSSHGIIPARHVYRSLRGHILDAPSGNAVADAILNDWPTACRYAPIRFTRTWLHTLADGTLAQNYSVHFPQQRVIIKNQNDSSVRLQREIPPHGFVYLPVETAETGTNMPKIEVAIAGYMTWIDGSTAEVWKTKGETNSLSYDLAIDSPHVILRLPMSIAILNEPIPRRFSDARCTYFSLRRSVRAIVDNRIAGGRLNYGPSRTRRHTRDIIAEAWDETGVPAADQHQARDWIVANGNPSVGAMNLGTVQDQLGRILKAFFPDTPAAVSNAGQQFAQGEVGYYIWISKRGILADTTIESDNHFGGGGAGALVYLGLADDYAFDPSRVNTPTAETDDQYYHRLATGMQNNLETGAALQFWNTSAQYELVKTDSHPCPGTFCGHSPLFGGYDATSGATEVVIIDQIGKNAFAFSGPAINRRLTWYGYSANIWCAANWNE